MNPPITAPTGPATAPMSAPPAAYDECKIMPENIVRWITTQKHMGNPSRV